MNNLEPRIFAGTSNPGIADKVVKYLGVEPGLVDIKRFSDGEIWVKFKENIRGRNIYIIQSTVPPAQNLLELLIMVDAAKRASAKSITAVIPYYGYARQDRKDQPRVSLAAKLIANLITTAGADRVISMDLHAAQIQGFFDIPFDHLYGSPIFSSIFSDIENLVVVAPDTGGIKLARSYAKKMHKELVVIDKRRPRANVAEVMNIIGDVEGKNVLLVDDLIDTAGTFVSAVEALRKNGALKILGSVTHALLSGSAIERIEKSDLSKLYISDTIPFDSSLSNKIEIRTASELFAEAIIRSHNNESISSLFEIDKS